MKKHAAPIIATILLLLPVLYVGSYLALVLPEGISRSRLAFMYGVEGRVDSRDHYRFIDDAGLVESSFWPLEQIDRKLRPAAWNEGAGFVPTEPAFP